MTIPGPSASLDQLVAVLEDLLYDAPLRAAFLADPATLTDPNPELADELALIDTYELAAVGRRIVSEILNGGIGSGVGLLGGFPKTFDAIHASTAVTEREVAESFVASPHYRTFRDVPYSPRGMGSTIAEAFYTFLATTPAFAPFAATAYDEAARFIVELIATNAAANFVVALPGSALFEFGGRRVLAIRGPSADDAEPTGTAMLYLAGSGRCIVGKVRAAEADLVLRALRTGPHRSGDDESLAATATLISKWGLW